MAENTRQVVVEVSAKLKGSDPFAKMGEGADKLAEKVRGRMAEIQEEINAVATKGGQAKEVWEAMIGASGSDDATAKLKNKITDTLNKAARQAEKVQVEGDVAPLLGSLRTVRRDMDGLKGAAEQSAQAMVGSFGRAGTGVMDLARGLTLLSSGQDDLAKMAQQFAKVQGVIDVVRGVWQTATGLAGAAANAKRWVDAMAAGRDVQAAFAAAQARVNAALTAEAIAERQAASAKASSTAQGAAASAENVRVATTAEQAAMALNAEAAAARNAAAGLSQQAVAGNAAAGANLDAAGGRAVAAGGARAGMKGAGKGALIGGALTALAGGGVGDILLGGGMSALGGLGGGGAAAGGGAGGAAAGAAAGGGLAAAAIPALIVAAVASVAFATAAHSQTGRNFMADKSKNIPGLRWVFGSDKIAETEGNVERTKKEGEFLRNLQSATGGKKLLFEEAAARRIESSRPYEERTRDLQSALGMAGVSAAANQADFARGRSDRALARMGDSYGQMREEMAAGRASVGDVARAAGGYLNAGLAGPEGSAETSRAIAEADARRAQALARVNDLQRQIAVASRDQSTTLTEHYDLQQQMGEAMNRLIEAEQRRVEAVRAGSRAESERLEKFRQFASEQARAFQAEAQRQRDKIKTGAEQFGDMDAMTRQSVLGVTRKVAAGQQLTAEEKGIAKQFDLLREPLAKMAEKAGQSDPAFQEIIRLLGHDVRLRQAEGAAQKMQQIAVEIQNKIEAKLALDERSLANEINTKVTPAIREAIAQTAREAAVEVKRQLYEQMVQNQAQVR